MPITPFIGVRISWLMLARKGALRRPLPLRHIARCRSSASARHQSIAPPTCAAIAIMVYDQRAVLVALVEGEERQRTLRPTGDLNRHAHRRPQP